MGLLEILSLISGVLKFPGEVMALIRLLQGTPEEHRQKIMEAIQKEADSFKNTGRPQP